jgi:hypothetical protein
VGASRLQFRCWHQTNTPADTACPMLGDSVEMSSVTQKDTFATPLLNSSFDEDHLDGAKFDSVRAFQTASLRRP